MDSLPLDPPFKLPTPEQYDVCITDVKAQDLIEIGVNENKPNLEPVDFPAQPFPIEGCFLHSNRFVVPLVCSSARPSYPAFRVWFLLNTSSPYTFISDETVEKLFGDGNTFCRFGTLYIQKKNVKILCYKSNEKFKELNILGSDVVEGLKMNNIGIDWNKKNCFIK
uniref:Uncharacterized protein n=1 Tax=Panagrolaimus sp. PS1159 TaxID=55785 RepID=A0AC35GWR2_9BILA